MSEQPLIESLQLQLSEKEELIAALTERLELAADQLDRYQRNGIQTTSKSSSTNASLQTSEEQMALLQQLQERLSERNDASLEMTLEQISKQISELHQSVSNNEAEEKTEGDLEDRLSSWAAIKAGVSEDQPEADSTKTETNSDQQLDEVAEINATEENREDILPEITWASLTLPKEIDIEQADLDTLSQAVENRDQYISYMVQKLRIAETTKLPEDWEAIEVPEELKQKLTELSSRLEETLRLSEIEISMERARLSRESIRLQMVEKKTIDALQKLGIDITTEGFDWNELGNKKPEEGSRWLRMLGIGNEE